MYSAFSVMLAAHRGSFPVAHYFAASRRAAALAPDEIQAPSRLAIRAAKGGARMFAGAAGLCRQRHFSGLAEVAGRDRKEVAIRSSAGSRSIPCSLAHSIAIACASAASVLTRNAGTATDLK